jgi:hypothetical protein
MRRGEGGQNPSQAETGGFCQDGGSANVDS